MADSKRTFILRVVSALLGIGLLLALAALGGQPGLYIVCSAAIVLGLREYSRMAFIHWHVPDAISKLFWFISVLFFAAIVFFGNHELDLLWFAVANVLFFVGCLWISRGQLTNDELLPALALGTFGMVYCVLFPNFAVELVKLDEGGSWFAFLLIVVFLGDTFAYFGGRFLGRTKMMPEVSPNKTWEGSLAGLMGSASGGTGFFMWAFPGIPWWQTAVFCLICGFAAQSGDLLMSLVKRVAKVKDSGGIMPGHGGILDRLDGIFISCPLVFLFSLYVRLPPG